MKEKNMSNLEDVVSGSSHDPFTIVKDYRAMHDRAKRKIRKRKPKQYSKTTMTLRKQIKPAVFQQSQQEILSPDSHNNNSFRENGPGDGNSISRHSDFNELSQNNQFLFESQYGSIPNFDDRSNESLFELESLSRKSHSSQGLYN